MNANINWNKLQNVLEQSFPTNEELKKTLSETIVKVSDNNQPLDFLPDRITDLVCLMNLICFLALVVWIFQLSKKIDNNYKEIRQQRVISLLGKIDIK